MLTYPKDLHTLGYPLIAKHRFDTSDFNNETQLFSFYSEGNGI